MRRTQFRTLKVLLCLLILAIAARCQRQGQGASREFHLEDRQITACGTRLHAEIQSVCRQAQYELFRANAEQRIIAPYKTIGEGHTKPGTYNVDEYLSRIGRSITEECCSTPCYRKSLLKYCGYKPINIRQPMNEIQQEITTLAPPRVTNPPAIRHQPPTAPPAPIQGGYMINLLQSLIEDTTARGTPSPPPAFHRASLEMDYPDRWTQPRYRAQNVWSPYQRGGGVNAKYIRPPSSDEIPRETGIGHKGNELIKTSRYNRPLSARPYIQPRERPIEVQAPSNRHEETNTMVKEPNLGNQYDLERVEDGVLVEPLEVVVEEEEWVPERMVIVTDPPQRALIAIQ